MIVLALALVGVTLALLVVALHVAELAGRVSDLVDILASDDLDRWPVYDEELS